jgi:hypothetical protein
MSFFAVSRFDFEAVKSCLAVVRLLVYVGAFGE